ncbi:hypothetical protein ACOMHN_026431 [Nucella lapillus]
MSHKRKTKPERSTFTSKLSDPHDVYPGDSNHWSIMRVEGDAFVLDAHQKERELRGAATQPPHPYPGCTVPPYVWSKEAALQLRTDMPFKKFVLQGLGGEVPGTLSKDLHKNYNKSIIHWPTNHFRFHAKENFRYWQIKDLTTHISTGPKTDRNKLPV